LTDQQLHTAARADQRGSRTSVTSAARALGRAERRTFVVRRLDAHDFRVVDLEHSIIAYDAAAALRAAADWIAFVLDVPDGSFDVRLAPKSERTTHPGRTSNRGTNSAA
jgi:hypothetical protein